MSNDATTLATIAINLPEALHPFVRLVLSDAELQARLGAEIEARAFVTAASEVAAAHGVQLDPALLDAALRPDPLGVGRFGSAPIICTGWPPAGWLPAQSVPSDGAPAFDWLWFGSAPLTLPFFGDHVVRARALPLNSLLRIRTNLAALIAGAEHEASLPLCGLIYHMSRCGSTLLAQQLAALPEVAVTSEAEPLDAVVQWAMLGDAPQAGAQQALGAIVAALGRDRGTGAVRHCIKLDAWHALALPLLRGAFPAVNWVHLYREATEVLVSTLEMPGLHTAPGMLPEAVLGFGFEPGMTLEDYAARALARVGEVVAESWPLGGGMVVAYPDIRAAAAARIAPHFGFLPDASDMAHMAAAGLRDAKVPRQAFVDDTQRKAALVSPAMTAVAERWLLPVQRQLEALEGTQ